MCQAAPSLSFAKVEASRSGALDVLRGAGRVRRLASLKGRALTDEALEAEWRGTVVVKRAGEQPIRRAAAREFRREERQILDNLETVSRSLVFDLDGWARSMASEIGPGALEAIRQGFDAGAARIGLADTAVPTFRPDHPSVRVPLRQILGKTRLISATTADRLTRSLSRGVAAGEPLDELASRVRAVFAQAEGYRARTIARTSAVTATESGQHYVMEEAGIDGRSWLSAFSAESRNSHVAASGQERGLDEPFDVGGYQMMYPGDGDAPADMVVNCLCTVLPLL